MSDTTPAERRALEAEIAIILGYTIALTPKDADGKHGGDEYLIPPTGIPEGYVLPPLGAIHKNFFVPRWTESWEKAKHLFDQLLADGIEASISGREPLRYCVSAFDLATKQQEAEFGTDVPLMICRCFLKVKGHPC